VRFRPAVLVTHPDHLMYVPGVIPVGLTNGGGIAPHDHKDPFVGTTNPYNMITLATLYNDSPRAPFLPLSGRMNPSRFADGQQPEFWYASAPVYTKQHSFNNENDYIVPEPSMEDGFDNPRIKQLAWQSCQFVYSHATKDITEVVYGSDVLGSKPDVDVYKSLSAGSETAAYLGATANGNRNRPY
jgi:hypothetical protein